jgi:hypothetical protein
MDLSAVPVCGSKIEGNHPRLHLLPANAIWNTAEGIRARSYQFKELQGIFVVEGIGCLFARSEKRGLAHLDPRLVTM